MARTGNNYDLFGFGCGKQRKINSALVLPILNLDIIVFKGNDTSAIESPYSWPYK